MPYADNEGIRIHYQIEGQGPPLVLHHWSLATLESWYDTGYVSALRDNHQLILLDARGHGASDKPRRPEAYALKERVEDVVAVLDDLGIDQTDFFGYSMGGWVGFGLARYAAERFRSLLIGGSHPYAQDMGWLRELVRHGVEEGPEALVALWEANLGALSEAMKERMLTYDYEALLMVAQDRENLEAVLPTMGMPCLLYVGEKDAVYPLAKECSGQIANVTFIVLPGLDHGAAIRQSDQVLPLVEKFLAAVNQRKDATQAAA